MKVAHATPAIFAEAQTQEFTDYAMPILTADEENLGWTLRELGVQPLKVSGRRPKTWSLSMGLDLWACVRLLSWEREGVQLHRKAGLPHKENELRSIILRIWEEAGKPMSEVRFGELAESVYRLMLESFAWAGPRELQTEVEVDFLDEDKLVEALAAFLWRNKTHPNELERS